MEFLNNNSTNIGGCTTAAVTHVANIAIHMVGFMIIVFFCNCLHFMLRPISQPRIISESIVGLTISHLSIIRKHVVNEEFIATMDYIVDFFMVCHMFVVGLEIDPNIFLHVPLHEAKVSTSSLLSTLALSFFVIPILKIVKANTAFTFCLSVVISGTNSPVLTRIITDLKIGKSDIGKFAVGAGVHSDVVFTLIISVGFIFFNKYKNFEIQSSTTIAKVVTSLVVQFIIGKKLTPFVMNWVNGENPEGKPMKGSHLVLSIAYVILVCSLPSYFAEYDKVLSAFLAGFSMPREGRVSKLMINKANYFFSAVFYPMFFLYVGTQLQREDGEFEWGRLKTWVVMVSLYFTGIVGKIIGSTICGAFLGIQWPVSLAIGMLLNTKGRFQLYLATGALLNKLITTTTTTSIMIVILVSIALKPLVVYYVIKRARLRSPTQRMALQWHNPSSELCILLCIHGPQNIPSVINLMEISRGSNELMIYLTEMIELTDKIAESLTYTGGGSSVTVTDREVVESREQTSQIVREYLDTAGTGISVQRKMALSYISTLHQDVCILAEDLAVFLIILPFHMLQDMDGKLVSGNSGFRNVNRKILRQAPCSVGILVDRGLGSTVITRKSDPINAAVIFIGGKDDREALMFAGRLARHPGVKLTVIRLMLDIGDEDSVSTRISKGKINTSAHQEEMKLDDECFTEFYDAHVAGGKVAYLEKYLVNSGQTFSTLRMLESQYSLFIVGRDGRVNSVLTVGMNDWEQCPELGPIGDILSGSEFSSTASILIIQQHNLKGGLDGLHDEFSIM